MTLNLVEAVHKPETLLSTQQDSVSIHTTGGGGGTSLYRYHVNASTTLVTANPRASLQASARMSYQTRPRTASLQKGTSYTYTPPSSSHHHHTPRSRVSSLQPPPSSAHSHTPFLPHSPTTAYSPPLTAHSPLQTAHSIPYPTPEPSEMISRAKRKSLLKAASLDGKNERRLTWGSPSRVEDDDADGYTPFRSEDSIEMRSVPWPPRDYSSEGLGIAL